MAVANQSNSKPCRDCGSLLEPAQRGCPRCAYNVEAEAMLGRFLWRRLVPGFFVLVVLIFAAFYFWRR